MTTTTRVAAKNKDKDKKEATSRVKPPAHVPVKISRIETDIKKELDTYAPELFTYYKHGMELLNKERRDQIMPRYERGALLVQAKKQTEARTVGQGEHGQLALGLAWQMSRSQIRDLTLVAERISREELNQFMTARNKRDESLTWAHLYNLAGIEPGKRKEFLRMTCNNNWSAQELYDHIANCDNVRILAGNREGGRGFVMPRTVPGFLHKTEKEVRSTLKYLTQVDHAHFNNLIQETPPDKIDTETLREMEGLTELYSSAETKLAAERASLVSTLTELAAARGYKLTLHRKPAPAGVIPPGRRPKYRPPAVRKKGR